MSIHFPTLISKFYNEVLFTDNSLTRFYVDTVVLFYTIHPLIYARYWIGEISAAGGIYTSAKLVDGGTCTVVSEKGYIRKSNSA
jgi:hypothetical protein